MNDIDDSDGIASPDSEEKDYHQSPGSPLSVELPAAAYILDEARRLAADKNIRVTDLATCVSQDPVIILELLRVSNSIHFIQDRPPITTAQTAVVHLGSNQVLEIIDRVRERPQIEDDDVSRTFETLRNQSQKMSMIARILANATRKDLAAEAQTTALMSVMGHLMACHQLGTDYVDLADNNARSKVVYRLTNNFNFNLHFMQLAYLRRFGFPEVLIFALDRDATCKTPWRQPLRYLVESSIELVEAFEYGKWDRYSPGERLPSNSAVRLLQITDAQYEKVFERCNDFLVKISGVSDSGTSTLSSESMSMIVGEGGTLGSENHENGTEEAFLNTDIEIDEDDGPAWGHLIKKKEQAQITIESRDGEEDADSPDAIVRNSLNDHFFSSKMQPDFVRDEDFSIEDPPDEFRYSRQAQWVMDEFGYMCAHSDDPTELIDDIMNKLIEKGPFERAALLALNEDRRSAYVLRSVGNDIQEGKKINLVDPISPLVSCNSSVKSFNAQGIPTTTAPLGISSFAVSPIDLENATPIALYVDCGVDGAVPFEARRKFRYLIELLNNMLPEVREAARAATAR